MFSINILNTFICFLLISINSVDGFKNPCDGGFVPFPSNKEGVADTKYDCVFNWGAFKESMLFLGKNLPNFDQINQVSLKQ